MSFQMVACTLQNSKICLLLFHSYLVHLCSVHIGSSEQNVHAMGEHGLVELETLGSSVNGHI